MTNPTKQFARLYSFVPTSLPQLLADDELQTRPNLIHSTNLDIDIANWQRNIANGVFGDVGRHSGRFLRPRYPDHPIWSELVAVARQQLLKLIPSNHEDLDDVGGFRKLCAQLDAFRQRLKQRYVIIGG